MVGIDYKDLIIKEIFKILGKQFPDDMDLQSVISSYGDTLSDEEIYLLLFDWQHGGIWNKIYTEFKENRLKN